MTRNIFLPQELDLRLTELTELKNEVNGILLYKQNHNICPIDAMFITGVGNEGHVQSLNERVEIVNAFLGINPSYSLVKFHTHSKGTILTYGEYYGHHYSEADIKGIKEQLKHDENFIALLVTPYVKLVSGIDNPKLITIPNYTEYVQNRQHIEQSLKSIANQLGYSLERQKSKIV
jgi:hypothetical protein